MLDIGPTDPDPPDFEQGSPGSPYTVPMIEIQPTTEHPLPFDLSDEQPKTHKDGIAIAVNTTQTCIGSLGPTIDYADKDLHIRLRKLINGTDKPNLHLSTYKVRLKRKQPQSLLRRLTSKHLQIYNRPAHSLLIS
jgi:hypothetical protein